MCEACPEMVNHNLHKLSCPLAHEFGEPTPECLCGDVGVPRMTAERPDEYYLEMTIEDIKALEADLVAVRERAERLERELADAETEKIERGTMVLRLEARLGRAAELLQAVHAYIETERQAELSPGSMLHRRIVAVLVEQEKEQP